MFIFELINHNFLFLVIYFGKVLDEMEFRLWLQLELVRRPWRVLERDWLDWDLPLRRWTDSQQQSPMRRKTIQTRSNKNVCQSLTNSTTFFTRKTNRLLCTEWTDQVIRISVWRLTAAFRSVTPQWSSRCAIRWRTRPTSQYGSLATTSGRPWATWCTGRFAAKAARKWSILTGWPSNVYINKWSYDKVIIKFDLDWISPPKISLNWNGP